MNNIHIYGDSFGEYQTDDKNIWYNKLSENFTVINNCQPCSSIKTNRQLLLKELPKNTNIIFLITNRHRLHYPFEKNIYKREDYICDKQSNKQWSYEVNLIYNMFDDEIELSSFQMILLLKYYSEKYNCKILILDCDKDSKRENIYDQNFYNNHKFKVVHDNIWQVSVNEFKQKQIVQKIEENRRNHMSIENHIILYNIISNFFLHTNLSEQFIHNIYDVILDDNKNIIDRYVYE